MKKLFISMAILFATSTLAESQQRDGISTMLSLNVGTETSLSYELALGTRGSLRLAAGAKVPLKNSTYTFAEEDARGIMPYGQLEWRYYLSSSDMRSDLNGGFYLGLQATVLDLEHKLLYKSTLTRPDASAITFGPKVGWQQAIGQRLYGFASFTLAAGKAFKAGWQTDPYDKGGLETAFELGIAYRL